jgi:hypothetical protein
MRCVNPQSRELATLHPFCCILSTKISHKNSCYNYIPDDSVKNVSLKPFGVFDEPLPQQPQLELVHGRLTPSHWGASKGVSGKEKKIALQPKKARHSSAAATQPSLL